MGDRNGLQLATLVPVLRRPHRVQPLINSFLESRTPGLLVFIVQLDDIDERIVLRNNEFPSMRILTTVNASTWPEKINVGVDQIDADWYLCAADDVHFHKGWWSATRELRDNPQIGVIGTNDMGNPRVIAGEHTTHPLIRRKYIQTYGTIDQPGVAIHEGYRHWYCDDELVLTAKHRDAWAFCDAARIEHLHPYWTGEQMDATYLLGESAANIDYETFKRRLPLLGLEEV